MFDWLWTWAVRWHKVTLAKDHIWVSSFQGEWELRRSSELSVWLHENPCTFRLRYNESTGARWIEFTDKKMAAVCKLTMSN